MSSTQVPSEIDMPMIDAVADLPIEEEEDANPTNIAFNEQRIRIVRLYRPY